MHLRTREVLFRRWVDCRGGELYLQVGCFQVGCGLAWLTIQVEAVLLTPQVHLVCGSVSDFRLISTGDSPIGDGYVGANYTILVQFNISADIAGAAHHSSTFAEISRDSPRLAKIMYLIADP